MLPKLRTWYKLHKWFSIFTGAAILVWLTSGILMVSMPASLYEGPVQPRSRPEYRSVTRAPAEAIAPFLTETGITGEVAAVDLRLVGDVPAYQVTLTDGERYLLQAVTGELLSITREKVVELAGANLQTDFQVTALDYLEHYTFSYLHGELPVYRLKLGDARGTHLYLSPDTGQLSAEPRSARIMLFIEGLHTFAVFQALRVDTEQGLAVLLWGSILLTIVAVLFGYYLALPHRRRARSRQNGTDLAGWLRKIRNWYALHRWLAIVTGVALLMWLVTGVTLTWNFVFATPGLLQPPVEYTTVTLAPAEVIELAPTFIEPQAPIVNLNLKSLLDTVVYEVQTNDNRFYLVDAGTGEPVQVSPVMAAALAQAQNETQTPAVVERIDAHGVAYPYGPIPVYRATFADEPGTHVYVNALTGMTWQNGRWGRMRILLGSLHTFDALRIVLSARLLITGSLVIVAALTLLTTVIGYYLALPYRWQIFTRRREKITNN